MTVAASILLAAVVGGIVFVLLDSWQRRADAAAERPTEPLPQPVWSAQSHTEPVWSPPKPSEPLWTPPRQPRWDERDDEDPPQQGLWSGWVR